MPAWLTLVAALAAPPAQPAEGPAVVERRLVLMGTQAEVRIQAANRPEALAASEAAIEALERAEARLSTWTEASELARLNRTPPRQPVALSPELSAELRAAEGCRQATGGAFDPGVGPLVDAWGLRAGGRRPDPGELAAARIASDGAGLELRPDGTALRRWSGLRIEEGGFGKGAALDAAIAALAPRPAVASARLDLGGQLSLLGRGGANDAVELAVAHPRDRRRQVLALAVSSGSVATSGNSERGVTVDGERRSHILDPRTGEPAPDFGSLTVWTDGPAAALRADCLATGLYVLGPEAALAWAAERDGVEALVIRTAGEGVGALEAAATSGLEGRLRALEPTSIEEIRFVDRAQPPAGEAGIQERRSGGPPASETDGATRRSSSRRGDRVGAR